MGEDPVRDVAGLVTLLCLAAGAVVVVHAFATADPAAQVPPSDGLVVRDDYRAGWTHAATLARYPDARTGWPNTPAGITDACRAHLEHRPHTTDEPSFLAGCTDRAHHREEPPR